MTDPGSEKWAQSVSLPDASVDPDTAQRLLEDIPGKIARGETSLGEDFPKSEAELLTRKRLPLLYAILEKGLYLDYLTGVSGFGGNVVSLGLEHAVDERAKGLFPLDFGSFGSSFPTTVVVHGTADCEISCHESEKLVAKLKEEGAGVQYYPVPGADHVFELELNECQPDGGEHEPGFILSQAMQTLQEYLDV
jgi:acetyl esterase/lipase